MNNINIFHYASLTKININICSMLLDYLIDQMKINHLPPLTKTKEVTSTVQEMLSKNNYWQHGSFESKYRYFNENIMLKIFHIYIYNLISLFHPLFF